MTCTAVKPDTWTRFFPHAQNTQQKSFMFVKKLLAVSVSNITYLRSILPEQAYGDRSLEGLNVKILKGGQNEAGSQLVKWLTGCYHAIERCYLRELTIGVYEKDDDPELLIESYTFRFAYSGEVSMTMLKDEHHMSTVSANLKSSTLSMIRTIAVSMQSLKPLPKLTKLTIKLLYYDEVTPPDYEPPGFIPCESSSFNYKNEYLSINMGEVETVYHRVHLRVKSDKKQFEDCEDEEDDVVVPSLSASQATISQSPAKSVKGKTGAKKNAKIATEEESGVRCACGLNEDDGVMIMCEICKFWQHMICYRVIDEKEVPEHHICYYCAEPGDPSRLATDPSLSHLSAATLQATCIWRRCLMACLELNRATVKQVKLRLGVTEAIAEGLMTRLTNEGFIDDKGKNIRGGQKINKEKIQQNGIPKYIFLQHVRQPLEVISRFDNLKNVKDKEKQVEKGEKNYDDVEELTNEAEKLNMTDAATLQPSGSAGSVPVSRKRVRLLKDKNQIFSMICSQDPLNCSTDAGPVIKKRKASTHEPKIDLF